jgi:uncharacterized protein YndB with AHSA1/START domain
MTRWTAEGSIDIDAPAARVFALVSDVTSYGRWAAETTSCRWVDDAARAVPGARFVGRNQNRWHRWRTGCVVTDVHPDRLFEFRVEVVIPTAIWRYEIAPTAAGCRVTERTARLYPRAVMPVVNLVVAGVADRDAHNRCNIAATLLRLKDHAEATANA